MVLAAADPLACFRRPVAAWFRGRFAAPTEAQEKAWPHVARGESTLLLAPTGSGKTLAAFLVALDRLMFAPAPAKQERCKVVYISPLKALAADVERNLRVPLVGIAEAAAELGVPCRVPSVAIRSGDTPASERAKMARTPPDIWITTPESFYLLLTSSARALLASVDTVIVDEIHSLVANKRGAHLFVSLERLEALRGVTARPLQRVGLSATQRPLSEVARLLGGGASRLRPDAPFEPRPVRVVDAGSRRPLALSVEVPVDDWGGRSAKDGSEPTSIWPSIYPRLVELIRAHRSTLIFVNNRRLAERLAAAVNETAGEELALSHHGSVAREKRTEIEARLKGGDLRAIVATSSLELGIDMGAIEMVVQIEAPPSIASGVQRIGRAGHSVGGTPRGVIFPKHRGDLLAAAAAAAKMLEGSVEASFVLRSPLDVLAQQIVACAAMDPWHVDELFALVRRAAPFAELTRAQFDGVLDMLSGRYPSDEFAELRPRIIWDRKAGVITGREGARRIAVVNAGTIPDRGLYGVFLAGSAEEDGGAKSRRVGELDEEMVHESKPGEVFLLGASSWRIEEISHDRVLVSPAPGQPGKMPFWHGDRPGRPLELGHAIGALARTLAREGAGVERLMDHHGLDRRAAESLVRYVREQAEATGEVPSDEAIVVDRTRGEMGDFRVCVLSPFGSRVHTPWAMAVARRVRESLDRDLELVWSDDGMVFRFPESDHPPDAELFFPAPEEVEDLVLGELGATSLFASHFRENASRALLLPRRRPGLRSPLWAQRKRAHDLLAVASRYGSFPILLETYRDLLSDVFDLPGLVGVLRDVEAKRVRVITRDGAAPSPFAASLLFSYAANFLYDEDAPVAERRAQALSVDQGQLRSLLGDAEVRQLLDPRAIDEAMARLQRLAPGYRARREDDVHDLLRTVGDLSDRELAARCEPEEAAGPWIASLASQGRTLALDVAGELRWCAAEDAARFRDALGAALPAGVATSFLEPVADPLGDLVSRYARTHGPFVGESAAARLGLSPASVREVLARLEASGRVVEGAFLRGGRGGEFCDAGVLRSLKQASLARLRKQIEPVAKEAFVRFLPVWQGVGRGRAGGGEHDLADALESLQGASIPASVLESEVLSARLASFRASDLDALLSTGQVLLRGLAPIGPRDGKVALYFADAYAELAPPSEPVQGEAAGRVLEVLERRGALFFSSLLAETRLYAGDLTQALWDLFWAGLTTNDTFAALRSRLRGEADRRPRGRSSRARIAGPPGTEGRFSLLPRPHLSGAPTETERAKALADQLLARYGVVTREAVQAEGLAGGFSSVYPVLKAMEEVGRVRRGYFVAGLAATQFALAGAEDRLRSLRERSETPAEPLVLSAADPANPFGAALAWPESGGARPGRAAGALVVLFEGRLLAYLGRAERSLVTFVPAGAPDRGRSLEVVARALAERVDAARGDRRAILISQIDGGPANAAPLAERLLAVGFVSTSRGLFRRRAV